MIEIDHTTCEKIHTRNIHVATYASKDKTIVVEGQLKDNRLIDSYRSGGKVITPGVVHNMIIRLKVRGPELIIEDIDVEMSKVPNQACLETRRSLEPIKGMSIVSGFTAKVKELVGGKKGCAHLLALLMAMAPAAVQGAWSAATRIPNESQAFESYSLKRLKNTCYVWRSDGPAYKKYKESGYVLRLWSGVPGAETNIHRRGILRERGINKLLHTIENKRFSLLTNRCKWFWEDRLNHNRHTD